jgi:hypothetical protein
MTADNQNQAWDLLTSGHLFNMATEDKNENDTHLAQVVTMLGPPPLCFLQSGE